ncbi:MAG: hypothetical protein K0B87_05345 [Candidatus Syntrophosphaera sp.]|nr:hypothetical protein [Candidatus Syntrophosphaera sp.]
MNKLKLAKLMTVLGLAALTLLAAGCVPRFFLESGIPDVVVVAKTPSSSQIPAPGVDAHFVYVDDYFIMEEPLTDQSYVYAAVAKMVVAPSPATDNRGKFRRLMDNQEVWTRYYAKTRIATRADMIVDKEVFFLNYLDSYGNYRAPESLSETQNSWWFKARVSGTADLHRGFLTIGGGYNVSLNALRVAVP